MRHHLLTFLQRRFASYKKRSQKEGLITPPSKSLVEFQASAGLTILGQRALWEFLTLSHLPSSSRSSLSHHSRAPGDHRPSSGCASIPTPRLRPAWPCFLASLLGRPPGLESPLNLSHSFSSGAEPKDKLLTQAGPFPAELTKQRVSVRGRAWARDACVGLSHLSSSNGQPGRDCHMMK